MLDLRIDRLGIEFQCIAGHEHRVRPIAARAAAIFAERLEDHCTRCRNDGGSKYLSKVSAPPLNVNLGAQTDEDAAGSIAGAWLQAVILHLR